jgi:hypothetical protein
VGGGDAISIQEARRKTHRGRKEEGGETVKAGGRGWRRYAVGYRAGGERTERGVVVPGGMCDWLIAATSGLSGRKQYSGSG